MRNYQQFFLFQGAASKFGSAKSVRNHSLTPLDRHPLIA